MALQNSRVRLVDIAAKAGVSPTVVSAALRSPAGGTVRVSKPVADRIRQIAEQLNYRPNAAAQLLKGGRSDVIGALIGAESTAANFQRLTALEHSAYERGLRLMIGHFRGDARRNAEYIEDFLDRGIQAMVCFHNPAPSFDPPGKRLLGRLNALVFQTHRAIESACCVDVDRAAGVEEAVRYLALHGRRRIALVLNDRPSADPLMADRQNGYLRGMEVLNRGVHRELIWCGTGEFPPSGELCDRAVEALVQRGQADAIVASNDVWAIGLIKSIRRGGWRVPDHIAVVGFDNLPAAELFDPPLTSIDQNNEAFAEAALDLLSAALDEQELPPQGRTLVVQPKLVVRESA